METYTFKNEIPICFGTDLLPNLFAYPWKWDAWPMRILFAFKDPKLAPSFKKNLESKTVEWAELEVAQKEGTGVLRFRFVDGRDSTADMISLDMAMKLEMARLLPEVPLPPSLRPLNNPSTYKQPQQQQQDPGQDMGGM